MLKLRRLRVDKFRNVEPGTELRFSDGFNVLLGQNGTGKTTLLELISRVVRSDFSELAQEEFDITYELAVEGATILTELRNRREATVAPITAPFTGGETFRPSMVAKVQTQDGRTIEVRHVRDKLRVDGKEVEDTGLGARLSLLEPGAVGLITAVNSDRKLLIGPFMKNVATVRFDESLDLFRELMGTGRNLFVFTLFLSDSSIVPRLPPFPVARSLLSRLAHLYDRRNPSDTSFTFSEAEFDFLAKVVELMGFDRGQLRIDVLERKSRNSAVEDVQFGNLSLRFIHEGGDFLTHERLSYGQKRLLTFFYYLDACPDIVIADELVNGLHHQWITASVDAMGARQAFLTSQNPLLLDYLPFDSTEQIQKSFVLCKSERKDGRTLWIWENMSEKDAAEFFSAYEIGVEHVSEILQSRGLW